MSDDTAAKFAAQQTVNVMTAMIIKGLVQVGGVTPATAAAPFASRQGRTTQGSIGRCRYRAGSHVVIELEGSDARYYFNVIAVDGIREDLEGTEVRVVGMHG